MAHFEFICHAPSDYYKHGTQYKSYPVDSRLLGCVWTTLGPSIETVDCSDAVSGDRPMNSQQRGRQCTADSVQNLGTENERKSMSFREKMRSHKAGFARSKDRLIK